MTKFRLSNHKLSIENGRHQGLDKNARICPFCSSVEDEIHFLAECKIYENTRKDLFYKVEEMLRKRNMNHMEGKLLLKALLLENEEILPLVAKYITRAMDLRDFLIDSHRQST